MSELFKSKIIVLVHEIAELVKQEKDVVLAASFACLGIERLIGKAIEEHEKRHIEFEKSEDEI